MPEDKVKLEEKHGIVLTRIKYTNGIRVVAEIGKFSVSLAIFDNYLVTISETAKGVRGKKIQLSPKETKKIYKKLMTVKNLEDFNNLLAELIREYQI